MDIYEEAETRVVNLKLYDFQVDVILEALQIYAYETNQKYPWRKISYTLEENIEKTIIRDTYHKILCVKNNKKVS